MKQILVPIEIELFKNIIDVIGEAIHTKLTGKNMQSFLNLLEGKMQSAITQATQIDNEQKI